jgi:hypothetical protein
VLKEQNRAFNVNPPPRLVMSKIKRWIEDPGSQGDDVFAPITTKGGRYTCLTMSSLDELGQHWRVVEQKLSIPEDSPMHSIISLFNKAG